MIVNDPSRAGQLATAKEIFGEFSQYAVYATHTRFDSIHWFVEDIERCDEYGLPLVIRSAATREEAIDFKIFRGDGIEVKIYKISGKHPYRLVLRDTDADEMVGAKHFVDLDQAIAYAEKCLL